jgi:4-diphosphocytidyl-2-C-methyl-D-erythritol kinase
MLTARPPAKVNLSLEVRGRRADGFHDLVSVMQTISLSDRLTVEPADEITLESAPASLAGPDNLVLRAAHALRSRSGRQGGSRLRLEKRIPTGAGLGGGSSDGAAALALVSRLWGMDLHCSALLKVAAELGSDLPFFLYGGIALVTGRGEDVRPLPDPEPTWYLLVNPNVHVATREIFAALRREEWSDGEETLRLAGAVRDGKPVALGRNTLQAPLFRLYPAAERCFREVEEQAPGRTIVTGSGPTVVALYKLREEAARAASLLEHRGYWTHVARSITATAEGQETPCR